VILLALDTCDARGSVTVLRDEAVLSLVVHESAEDYSLWLLPAVDEVLKTAGLGMRDVEVYAAACGPGSFTGVRVGLTTVKAWNEVYGRPIAAVSRLEALATQSLVDTAYVAAFVDAHREQVFAALYRGEDNRLVRIEDEVVIAPAEFVEWVGAKVGTERVAWVSPDMETVARAEIFGAREKLGDVMVRAEPKFAPAIGRIGYRMALEKRTTDALTLDANYVRRTDAEALWKGGASRGR
jgi:tRNA threonylcarbamoyladenosine biosynthesis protein TsaB